MTSAGRAVSVASTLAEDSPLHLSDDADEAESSVRLRTIPGISGGSVGVFATRAIPAGKLALGFPGKLAPDPDRYSIQVDADTHLIGVGTPADELRHSCEPNACVVVDDAPPARVVALRDIAAGEEITIDYCATEDVISHPFECRCGARSCYGEIRGYRFLDEEQRARLAGVASVWLVERDTSAHGERNRGGPRA